MIGPLAESLMEAWHSLFFLCKDTKIDVPSKGQVNGHPLAQTHYVSTLDREYLFSRDSVNEKQPRKAILLAQRTVLKRVVS